MDRRAEDEELDKLLEEELIWEAEMIERGLLLDHELGERHMSKDEIDASFDKLVEKLKAEGVYREDEKPREESSDPSAAISVGKTGNSGRIISMPERNTSKGRSPKRRYGLAKVVGFSLVCVLSVLGASMSIEGNRQYFLEKINYYTGNDTRIDVGNVEGDADNGVEEQEAIDAIENELSIKMPIFRYRPKSFKFYKFQIDEQFDRALLKYEYKDVILTLIVNKKDNYEKKENYSLDGKEIETTYCDHGTIRVAIMKIQDEGDNIPNYAAQWEYNTTFYSFTGKVDKEEFIKIIEKMQF